MPKYRIKVAKHSTATVLIDAPNEDEAYLVAMEKTPFKTSQLEPGSNEEEEQDYEAWDWDEGPPELADWWEESEPEETDTE